MGTTVKLRTQVSGSANADGKGYSNSSLTVPREIARALETAGVTTFECELTEDGILFRPAREKLVPEAALPSWLKSKA